MYVYLFREENDDDNENENKNIQDVKMMKTQICTTRLYKYQEDSSDPQLSSSELPETEVDDGPGLGRLAPGQTGRQLAGDLQVGQQEEGQGVLRVPDSVPAMEQAPHHAGQACKQWKYRF